MVCQLGYSEDRRRMREAMAGRLVILLLLPVTWMAGVAAGTGDTELIHILISKNPDGFSATWYWNYECMDIDKEITFTAFYKKLGVADTEPQTCEKNCSCEIPPNLLDHNYNYTLVVSATTAEGETLTKTKDFDPNRKTLPPPDVSVTASDALVIVEISTQESAYKESYTIILRNNNSTEEKKPIGRSYVFPPSDLLAGETYCVSVNVYNKQSGDLSPFSPEECFTAPAEGLPNNLRMEAQDLRYLLKWDWDFDQSPNATFSVEKCTFHDSKCNTIRDCKNITTTHCNCTELYFIGSYILRVSVYDSHREERSSSVIQFAPCKDTVIGPPKDLKMRIEDNELYINVSPPEGFTNKDISSLCDWVTHLEYWINSTHKPEVMEDAKPFFKIGPLETSTTYCAKAKMRCEHRNSSLYSKNYCTTTDPRSHWVAWITGFVFLGIVVISVVLYICFCPLKRCMKQIFFPASRLPSSIEKGFGESYSDSMKRTFLLHDEETMDTCYIVQDPYTEDSVQINYKNTSKTNSKDSGNCSNEGQTSGETDTQ